MKVTLLTVLLMLLCVGWAEACHSPDPAFACTPEEKKEYALRLLRDVGPLPHDVQIITKEGDICDFLEEPGHRLIVTCPHFSPDPTRQEVCLAKMEAAMKAIKPFLFSSYTDNQSQAWRDDWARQRDKAIWLFLDVERDCWQK